MDQPEPWTRLEQEQSSQLERVDPLKLTRYHRGGSDRRHGDWQHLPAEALETEPQAFQVHSKVAQSGLGWTATHSGLDTTEPSGSGGREPERSGKLDINYLKRRSTIPVILCISLSSRNRPPLL